ncbi:MAG: FtsX-like permease family protein [Phycisphaerae bacterium]|nr:FtsX-like permease family protein [Phycisphaerae bacterium]
MNPRARRILFQILAPVSVPAYALLIAYVNLTGLAYYLVLDLTAARIARRPIALRPGAVWACSPLAILVAAAILPIHLLFWFARVIVGGLETIGRWQTGLAHRGATVLAGAIWSVIFLLCVVLSIDGVLAYSLVGREIPGRREYSEALRRRNRLGELPPAVQQRRQTMLQSLRSGADRDLREADSLVEALADDDTPFESLHEVIQFRLVGIPWFFVPAEVSRDGSAHCVFMPGLLLLSGMLMVRWPGLFRIARPPTAATALFLARVTATAAAATWANQWLPARLREPAPPFSSALARAVAPLHWLGMEPGQLPPPEWLMLNAGLALVLFAAVIVLFWIAGRLARDLALPRYYSAFLAARLLQRKRIAFFSISAVTLCVAMLLIVISVMGGFVDTIRSRATGLLGDIVMDGGLRGFPYYAEFIEELRRRPDVEQATALIQTYGTLRFENGQTYPVQIWGITLDEYCGVNQFCRDLYYAERYPGTTHLGPVQMPVFGFDPQTETAVLPEPYESALAKWLATQPREVQEQYARRRGEYFPGPGIYRPAEGDAFKPALIGKPYPGVIIGRDIIARRTPSGEYQRSDRFPRGCICIVTMLPLTRSGAVSAEPPPAPAFRYVDDSRTGIYEIDSKNIYVDFKTLQEKLAMGPLPRADNSGMAPARCSQIQIKFRLPFDLLGARGEIAAAWDEFTQRMKPEAEDYRMMTTVHVSTWEELQAEFIAAIQKEKVLVVIMFGIISVVAVFLILCIFYMIVLEKTRDIGIIKSVGGSPEGVAAIFLTYGAAIGIVGSALGSFIGIAFVRRINDIQDWLARLNPDWRIWSPESYSFDKIPDQVKGSDLALIVIAAILASVIGAVVPALRAARTWPVEALRYE